MASSIITKTMKKQTEIVVEITENIELDAREAEFEAFCTECRRMVRMTTPKMCARLKKISEREIFRLIEARRIHFVENGDIRICLESVEEALGKEVREVEEEKPLLP